MRAALVTLWLAAAGCGLGSAEPLPTGARSEAIDDRCKDRCELSETVMPTRRYIAGQDLEENQANIDKVCQSAKAELKKLLDADVKECEGKKNFCAATVWHDYDNDGCWPWRYKFVGKNQYELRCLAAGYVRCATLQKEPPPVILPPSRP